MGGAHTPGCSTEGPGRSSGGVWGALTFQPGVGLHNELAGLLAEENRVPEGEEALGGRISDRRVPLIQGPAASHIPRGLQHLWESG